MKLCYFCPKCKCEICIFHSIYDNGEESCYWGYIDEARKWLKQPHTQEERRMSRKRYKSILQHYHYTYAAYFAQMGLMQKKWKRSMVFWLR